MATKTCLKCGATSEVPDDRMAECPTCGAIYSRVEEALARQPSNLAAQEHAAFRPLQLHWVAIAALPFVLLIGIVIGSFWSARHAPSVDALKPPPQPSTASQPKAAMSTTNEPPSVTTEASSSSDRDAVPQEPENHHDAWAYSANPTPMITGGVMRLAMIQSLNTVEFGFPYQGEQRALLAVRLVPNSEPDVMFSIERGQLDCSSVDGCSLSVKFDDSAAEQVKATGPNDHSSQLLFLDHPTQFIARLESAKSVKIQPVVYENGSPVFEFRADGFSSAKLRSQEINSQDQH